MPALNTIPSDKFARLIGIPTGPVLIDVRPDDEFASEPLLISGTLRRPSADVAAWAGEFQDRAAVVACRDGRALSQGVAARLRHEGVSAEALEGGVAGWAGAGLPMVPNTVLPPRDAEGRTVWVTRGRPKVDRIACPWLIRRFVDPSAIFLFVAPSEVQGVAERFGAAPFDIEGDGIVWSHRDNACTFDVMVEAFGLGGHAPLARLAPIVRGADTGRPDLVPEAAGLLAASLGLSRMYADDLEQLEGGMLLYDAFYRWCRDATDETHNWVSHQPAKARAKDKVRS
ncbi:sulfurtransferase/chromate resistance protein [Sphingopyxis indica]|uniref:sulfurtransferase/chromate resistance protein n=1 Tax=Sphingopyxis indica TaxID=436663 RepID=UPI0029391472|nr:sulfurtransferase/chromate resistance protein [Sphingopyxis indica]WOF44990.1 sulfurtransferase/chromate resistance protein [Sphingopyxis indica]